MRVLPPYAVDCANNFVEWMYGECPYGNECLIGSEVCLSCKDFIKIDYRSMGVHCDGVFNKEEGQI